MSIATRTGDGGLTGLMFNRRVPKDHPRVEAYGTVDELNAALGFARSGAGGEFFHETLIGIQNDLVALMGQLACLPEDAERYVRGGYARLQPDAVDKIDRVIHSFEKERNLTYKGWATPGGTPSGAAFDLARTVCRRAERRIVQLDREDPGSVPPGIFGYLNRLSDLLYLLARWVNKKEGVEEIPWKP